MSGGKWGYLGPMFDTRAAELEDSDAHPRASESLRLLALVEHELDWGYSCDTCRSCAEKKALCLLVSFFETEGMDASSAAEKAAEVKCERCRQVRHL